VPASPKRCPNEILQVTSPRHVSRDRVAGPISTELFDDYPGATVLTMTTVEQEGRAVKQNPQNTFNVFTRMPLAQMSSAEPTDSSQRDLKKFYGIFH
jgi:hypothetical protein